MNIKRLNCSSKLSNFHINVQNQLQEYFYLKRRTFDIFYKVSLSSFSKKVLEQIDKIPYGETLSYAQVAKNIHNSKAYRAVGMACKNNPIPIVIPCHRVVLNNGQVGGYVGGYELKAALLKREII